MYKTTLLLALSVLLVVPGVVQASAHNDSNALDVDNNGLIQPRDLLLVFNELHTLSNPPSVTPLASTDEFFCDTNDSGFVSPIDALLVVNALTTGVPEPSSILTASAALVALAGYGLRRKRTANKPGLLPLSFGKR